MSGSKNNDNPKANEPMINPITIPTIGKMYMYFATVSRLVVLLAGIIVRNENTEPISLSMNPPAKIR
jgi:hypothetical protein